MFRKSRRQQKQDNKRKRYTKKNNKTIRGAGLPGIFKWAVSNISGDTLFGKSIYTIRKDNYEPNTVYLKNDFIRILSQESLWIVFCKISSFRIFEIHIPVFRKSVFQESGFS